jgi:uncharacterized protein DUF4160
VALAFYFLRYDNIIPEISRFYGIVIKMYFADLNPPHFHAMYGEAEFDISTLNIVRGALPRRAHSRVIKWALLHRMKLEET